LDNYKLTEKGRGFYAGIRQRKVECDLDKLIVLFWHRLDCDVNNIKAICLNEGIQTKDLDFELQRMMNRGLIKYE
jgi:hypothetical protein